MIYILYDSLRNTIIKICGASTLETYNEFVIISYDPYTYWKNTSHIYNGKNRINKEVNIRCTLGGGGVFPVNFEMNIHSGKYQHNSKNAEFFSVSFPVHTM